MSRRVFSLAAVIFLAVTTAGLAQDAAVPAATRAQTECSGFIAPGPVSQDIYVKDGADDDYQSYTRQFVQGEFVYLDSLTSAGFSVGSEYRIIRPANEGAYAGFAGTQMAIRSFSRVDMYPGQAPSMRSLGTPYEDAGIVKITQVTPEGAIAEVTFTCGAIYPSDIAISFQARPIPTYTPTKTFDRFAPPDGKRSGAITATRANVAFLGIGDVAYVNLGSKDGASAGQRYRVFKIFREYENGLRYLPPRPRGTVGEMIILSTQERSSVGIIVNSTREIAAGDGIELE